MKQLLISLLFIFTAGPSFGQMHDAERPHPSVRMHLHPATKFIKLKNQTNLNLVDTLNHIPAHRAFMNASTSWTPGSKLSYSLEAGTWGISSYTSFSAVVDFISVDHQVQLVVGPKAYYTSYNGEKLSYMFYVAPKLNLTTNHGLLEYGFNQNYRVTPDFIIGVTLGNQLLEDSLTTTFGSLGIIYLIHKN